MRRDKTNDKSGDPETLALLALGWLLADERRADRLLALTGLDAAALRNRIGDRAMLAAVLDFLQNHEPDLVACAEAIGCAPADLIAAARAIGA